MEGAIENLWYTTELRLLRALRSALHLEPQVFQQLVADLDEVKLRFYDCNYSAERFIALETRRHRSLEPYMLAMLLADEQ